MADQCILIVGASGGIGSQLVPLLSTDRLALHYCQHVPSQTGFHIKADITRYDEVEQLVATVLRELGRIDVLINAAGVSTDVMTHKFPADAWREVIEANLVGTFNVIRAALPAMRAAKYGRIISLSSIVFQRPVFGTSAYSASKAGLVGLTRTVALESAALGITCNTIALGYFEAGLLYRIPAEPREQIRQLIPMKRFGRVEELHRTIQYLIDTEYITGQVLSLNGGLYNG